MVNATQQAMFSAKEIRLIAKQRLIMLSRIRYNRDLMDRQGGKFKAPAQYIRGLEVAEECIRAYDNEMNLYIAENNLDTEIVWDEIHNAQTELRQEGFR